MHHLSFAVLSRPALDSKRFSRKFNGRRRISRCLASRQFKAAWLATAEVVHRLHALAALGLH